MKQLFFILVILLQLPINSLAQSNFIDPTFGNNGFVVRPNQEGRFLVYFSDLTGQDAIVVAGSRDDKPFIQKFSADGQIDENFGNQGLILLDTLIKQPNLIGHVQKFIFVEDEQLICLVSGELDGASKVLLVKIDLLGNLDTDFADEGKFTYNADVNDRISAEDIGSSEDGSIFVLFKEAQGFTGAIFKLNAAGQLDTTYGEQGVYRTIFTSERGEVGFSSFNQFNIYPDGSVLAIGNNTSIVARDIVFNKLSPNGQIDDTFGEAGIVRIDFSNEDDVGLDLHVTDTAIYFLGGTTNEQGGISLLGRLSENGQIDASFGNNGFILFPRDSLTFVGQFLTPYQDKIILTGTFFDESFHNKWGMMSYDENGLIQNVFQSESKRVIVDYEPSSLRWGSLTEDKNGKLVAAGVMELSRGIFMTRLSDPDLISNTTNFHLDQPNLIQELYPNPARDYVYLTFSERRQGLRNLTVSIVNINGQVLSEQTYNSNVMDQELRVPVNALSPGLYFLQCFNAQNQKVGIASFIKQ